MESEIGSGKKNNGSNSKPISANFLLSINVRICYFPRFCAVFLGISRTFVGVRSKRHDFADCFLSIPATEFMLQKANTKMSVADHSFFL